eukprot:COSAG04_NODE_1322_length_7223_cov_2.835626_1_plen_69_part_00
MLLWYMTALLESTVPIASNSRDILRARNRKSKSTATRIELKVISVKHFKEEAAEFVKCIAKVEFRGES